MICKICHLNETDSTSGICWECINKRFNYIESNIGKDLFNQLLYEDKMLMVNTAGVIDFGYPIDLKKIKVTPLTQTN